MKKMLISAIMAASLAPMAMADLAGPKGVPVQKEKAPQSIGPIVIPFQKSVPINVENSIAGVSIGSPFIADVVVHNEHLFFVTGKSYGQTSLHVVDAMGNVILNTVIQVVDASNTQLVLNKGGVQVTMDCAPKCRPAPNIGDDHVLFTNYSSQVDTLGTDGE